MYDKYEDKYEEINMKMNMRDKYENTLFAS